MGRRIHERGTYFSSGQGRLPKVGNVCLDQAIIRIS